jgi:SAM-dependent methyltransferase
MKHPIDINNYWGDRKDHDLYTLTKSLIRSFFSEASSAIDVGSYIGGLICDLDWIDKRIATDIQDLKKNWEAVDGVEFVMGDAFNLGFPNMFDLVISNQTVEHLEQPEQFVNKLLDLGRGLILTTTYQTPYGLIPGHIQDPIDMEKFASWFPCKLDAIAICYHPSRTIGHIIGVVKQSHPNAG